MVEGQITVSELTGWPAWGKTPIILAQGASLTIGSQTGNAIMDFTMMSDRLVVPPPGTVHLTNIKAANLCTFSATVGLSNVTAYLTFTLFPIWHSWSRTSTRTLYVKSSELLIPRGELQMMTYWYVFKLEEYFVTHQLLGKL